MANLIKRVLLIHPEGNTFNNPTLKCIVDLLVERGVDVTIRYQEANVSMPRIAGVTFRPCGTLLRKIKTLFLSHLCSTPLSWLIVSMERLWIYTDYDLVIGVDREGVIEAGLLCGMTGWPFVFFSFEIMFESETSRAFKALERNTARSARAWFVQDELRAEHLQRENGLNPIARVLVPVASSGPGIVSSVRLRDKLGIPLDKKVALVMGSLSRWSMASAIVTGVEAWPKDWVLIVHERYGRTAEAWAALGISENEIPIGKVYFSNQATTMVDDMGEVLAGVSAGLAFYKPYYDSMYTGKNLEYLGLSSGKIGTFLRYGIPVIMNEAGLYADFAKRYKFGLVAADASDIGRLLPLLDGDFHRVAARQFYSSQLDFANYRDLVWDKLMDAASTR